MATSGGSPPKPWEQEGNNNNTSGPKPFRPPSNTSTATPNLSIPKFSSFLRRLHRRVSIFGQFRDSDRTGTERWER
ncbi:hypothetical protein F2Q70_00009717 [Brassica cretica]|uniref:Uncharacterized protein n=1 Tax=Brassica cretica TaxID=69181 RepID=A0A8S9LV03_BRACR|nr:hypothetical protein F2Q70_00009717 [Brassica cretica]